MGDIFEIGKRVRERREELGLTRQELADKSGISVKSVREYEGKRAYPRIDYLCYLADGLDCTTDWLLGRTERMNR